MPLAVQPDAGARVLVDQPGRVRTVAVVPGGHAYSRTVMPVEAGFVALPDPHPDLDGEVAGARWWPPRMLTPEWVARSDFDLMHVHFGVEQVPMSTLEQTVRALRETGDRSCRPSTTSRTPTCTSRPITRSGSPSSSRPPTRC